jgi:hypothetical protein
LKLRRGKVGFLFACQSDKRLAGKGHRLAAWQKDNEAFIPQQRDEAFRPAISRPENDFLYSCPFVSIRGTDPSFRVLDL